MRFLVVGLGSAGQRHARVIRRVFPNATIDAYVGEHKTGLISADLKSVDYRVNPISFYRMNEIKSFNMSRDKYDLAVIATPISSHFYYFKMIEKNCRRIIIEKPMASSISEAESIRETAIRRNLPVLIGYQHNFNPLVRFIIAECKKRGIPKTIELTFHEYLRSMNAFRDMSRHHLAQPNGGGALLALSHELDILLQISKLEISELNTELKESKEFPEVFDQVLVRNATSQPTKFDPVISVSLSYAAGEKMRCGTIEWTDFIMSWDFISGKIMTKKNGQESDSLVPLISGDELITLQLIFILNKSSFDEELRLRVDRALAILRINEAAKVLGSPA
jgi:predicted dehydrogenase